MNLPGIDIAYLLDFLKDILNTPSPTGFTQKAIGRIEKELIDYPFLELRRTRKGSLLVTWRVEGSSAPRALTAHIDTLGAMVKEIKSSGRLKMTKIGGYAWNTIEGEGCKVFTSSRHTVRGSILLTEASGHVFGSQVNETKRDDDNMEVRLDALTSSAAETRVDSLRIASSASRRAPISACKLAVLASTSVSISPLSWRQASTSAAPR